MAANSQGLPRRPRDQDEAHGEPIDAERVRAVAAQCPTRGWGVDANQAFTRATFRALLPVLLEARIALIEQPFPVGQESLLDDLECPIPIAADESVQTSPTSRGSKTVSV